MILPSALEPRNMTSDRTPGSTTAFFAVHPAPGCWNPRTAPFGSEHAADAATVANSASASALSTRVGFRIAYLRSARRGHERGLVATFALHGGHRKRGGPVTDTYGSAIGKVTA